GDNTRFSFRHIGAPPVCVAPALLPRRNCSWNDPMKTKTLSAALALTLSAGLAAFGASPAFAADAAAAPASAASAANAVRPEFATPFNAAQAAMKAGQGNEALAKLKEAEAIGNLSPYETYLVTRVRGPAAYAAGDMVTAERDFEASLASPLLP